MTKAQLSRIAPDEGLATRLPSRYFDKIPSRGGAFESASIEVCRLSGHFAALGKIQARVNALPRGARITSVWAA